MDLEAVERAPTAEAPLLFAAGQALPADAAALDPILAKARSLGATHLHLEPVPDGMRVCARVGGALAQIGRLSRDAGDAFVMRIKRAGGQEGRFEHHGQVIGVSSLALQSGDRMVLRLETGGDREVALEALGMRAPLAMSLGQAIERGGLVLIAGAPGSGRSTTLRTLLALLAQKPRSLILVEDRTGVPVAGISRALAGPVAERLRDAIDQDADAIAIDALAERADAALAIDAAQAGRLVLAVVPATDAVGAIRQMREWRVDPFPLASTLNMVIAQRKVRRMCPECRMPVQAEGSVSALLGFDPGTIIYSPEGCGACDGRGFAGETGVFEAIEADAAIRRLINDGGDGAILARHAFLRAPNFGSAARALVREGAIAADEAVRVSRG